MKKWMSVILSMLMVFALTGCGSSSNDDLAAIKEKGKIVVGITDCKPMDYKEDGKWVGFDAEQAELFAESIGVEAEFVEIDWDNKIMELDGGTVDCIWNGMTLTDEVDEAMSCTNAYLSNQQIIVCPKDKADDYQSADSIKGKKVAVEAGSAGESVAKEAGAEIVSVKAQSDAVMEVAAGTSEIAIIDSTMAKATVGEGTSYSDLTSTVVLNEEKYVVGFRKDSNLTEECNKFLKDKYDDGTLTKLAKKYGVEDILAKQ